MRILVTGGTGFIGSNLCTQLLLDNHIVYCIDNNFTGRMINIEKHNLAIRVKIPYSDQKIISFIYQKCKVLRREDKKNSIIFDLNIEPKYSDILKIYCMDSKK